MPRPDGARQRYNGSVGSVLQIGTCLISARAIVVIVGSLVDRLLR